MSPNLKGAMWMVIASAAGAGMAVFVRLAATDIHAFEIAFIRQAIGVVVLAPWLAWAGRGLLRTRHPFLHLARAVAMTVSMFSYFLAVTMIPIAEATALAFTAPLFAALGAALWLGETIGPRRWLAVTAGLLGALVMLRPGFAAFESGQALALLAGVSGGIDYLLVKRLTATDRTGTVVVLLGLIALPLCLPAALPVWTAPTAEAWPWLLAVGVMATIGQGTVTYSLALGEASFVLPFNFTVLVFTAALGWLVFGERPDAWSALGAGLIGLASVYLARGAR